MRRFLPFALFGGLGLIVLAIGCEPATEVDQAPVVAAPKPAPARPDEPASYPDDEGFRRRSQIILDGLADNNLEKWRTGYFKGGDPGKYMPGPAMAMLLKDRSAEMPRKYINDDRSHREHYHFAAVNWARFLPLFKDVLTDETLTKLAQQAGRYTAYHSGTGTENHKVMWYTSALVLPHYLGDGRLGNMSKAAVLEKQKQWLRSYVKGLYVAGQGEWDSSTYLMFDVNGMLNVYDFAQDEEVRLLARAALDWYAAGYALKYCDGVYTAPNQRGFASKPAGSIADQTGWLWWGGNVDLTSKDTRNFLYTVHAITSTWRPNKVITNIARRNLPKLPFDSSNSKPNYWFGANKQPEANQFQESLRVTRHYTMGSLWNGWGGQMTRFQIAASTDDGAAVFTGGHPTGYKWQDGNGKYDQSAQVGPTYIVLSEIPGDDPLQYVFFTLRDEANVTRAGEWFVMRAGRTYIGLYPLGEGKVGQTDLSEKQEAENDKLLGEGQKPRHQRQPIIRVEGGKTGFIVETADADEFADISVFAAAIAALRPQVDKSDSLKLSYTNRFGRAIEMAYQPGQPRAAVAIDGAAVGFENWPVYDGPYVMQVGGVLTVNDGVDGFVIDFSGDMPVYRQWRK